MKQQPAYATVSITRHRALHAGAVLLLLVCVVAADVPAATWSVEKDGSGDFTVIQDAVDAAEAGDTIQIGAGRFQEFREFQLPGGIAQIHVRVEQDPLTIVGAGQDVTIIGPADGPGTQTDPYGIMVGASARLTVSNLTVENVSAGIQANGPAIFVSDCTLRACDIGLDILSWDGIHVEGSNFIENADGIIVFQGLGAKDVIINDCQFLGNLISVILQSDNNLVSNCTFDGLYNGVDFQFGAWGTIRNCQFRNLVGAGLIAGTGASVQLLDSQFEVADKNITISSSSLIGSGNVLMGGTFETIFVSPNSVLSMHDSHIFNAGGWTIHAPGNQVNGFQHDLRNNYWGTPDAAQIAQWIQDGNDTGTTSIVLFEPFHGMPVSTERTSFGSLKARFGADPQSGQ